MPKPVSGKQKKQMLKQARIDKQQAKVEREEDVVSDKPRNDPNNFFLKFVNDSDQTVELNKHLAGQPFDFKNPKYKIDQRVYLNPACCPSIPQRPPNPKQMTPEQYIHAEDIVFNNYFKSVSPDLQTVATQFCQFELNKNVYREVWRVTERSHVVCLLVDARFPLAHAPHSFLNYFKRLEKPVLILMNKIDLVSKVQVEQWTEFFTCYLKQLGIKSEVIPYSAYCYYDDKAKRYAMLEELISKSRALSNIQCPKPITIGFMGQPSVGKSKTMNMLLGKQVTAVRLTAGCTKHLQTYFLEKIGEETDRSVQFCDCPGMVLPVKGSPRPLQIITGVFPTGRVREFYSAIRLLVENSVTFHQQVKSLVDQQMVRNRYGVEDFEMNTPDEVLNLLAYQQGFLIKGNAPWAHRAGLKLIKKVTEGTFVYEVPVGKEVQEFVEFKDKWANVKRNVKYGVIQKEEEQEENHEEQEENEETEEKE
ncbi:GTP-binding_protein [Hexamita inflata]|uniref:Guanine nucleotide-binding protein-like 1 n=1 Tax=Hexamita inflata TaxID=28002 RepID=A0AA86TI06_9EUKA|nr:GTP-binding protein [Hexamita inflata]